MPGGPFEVELNRVVAQEAARAEPPSHLAREDRSHGAVDVADRQIDDHGRLILERRPAEIQELSHVDRLTQPVILRLGAIGLYGRRDVRLVEHLREIEPAGLPVLYGLARIEPIDAADHFIDRAEAEPGHDLAHFFRQQEEEIDGVVRFAGEFLSQLGVLSRNAHGASIQMTLSHHDAADRNQRGRGDAPFLGPEQGGDHDVFCRADHAVGLHDDSSP